MYFQFKYYFTVIDWVVNNNPMGCGEVSKYSIELFRLHNFKAVT